MACPIACLDRYLRVVKGVGLRDWRARDRTQALFVDQLGRPFTADRIKELVRRVAAWGGVDGVFGGHSIRITGVCLAAQGGMSMEMIKAIGGWRSQAVEVYLRGQIAVHAQASRRMGL